MRCIQKDLIKYRFLVWHYNRKCLCKISQPNDQNAVDINKVYVQSINLMFVPYTMVTPFKVEATGTFQCNM